jgi:uncharacterized protein (DUF2225 family)
MKNNSIRCPICNTEITERLSVDGGDAILKNGEEGQFWNEGNECPNCKAVLAWKSYYQLAYFDEIRVISNPTKDQTEYNTINTIKRKKER